MVDGPASAITIGDLRIDRGLTREAFLATAVGGAAPVILSNEPWCSWKVDAEIDGEVWNFGIYFRADDLMFVSFGGGGDGRFGEPWAPDTEAARLRYHDDARERWGLTGPEVRSGIDPKEGSAGITVVYRR